MRLKPQNGTRSLGGYPGVVALPDGAEGCRRGGEDARRGVSLPGERPEANRGSSNKNKIAIQKGKHKLLIFFSFLDNCTRLS
jgi:hypothetical protein